MNLIDTHCHLFFPAFESDLEAVLQRAENTGVTKFIVPATAPENFQQVIDLIEKYEQVYGAIGVHPYDAHALSPSDYDQIREFIKHPKIVAVGETGLDFHREGSEIKAQLKNFEWHIQLALETDLPLIVHCRSSKDDILRLLNEYRPKGVVHCFSEDLEFAQKLFDINFHISFTGIMTYKSSKKIQEVAQKGDLDRIMVETDSPFLKPGEHRTEDRCEPADVVQIAEKIAELRGISLEEVAGKTTENAEKLFDIRF